MRPLAGSEGSKARGPQRDGRLGEGQVLVDGPAQRRAPLPEDKIAVAVGGRCPHLFVGRIPQVVQPLEARAPTLRAPPVEALAPAEASAREGRHALGCSLGAALLPIPDAR